MYKRVLVAGGCGGIGRAVVEELRARDTVWARTRMQAHVISRRPRYNGSDAAGSVEPPEVLR